MRKIYSNIITEKDIAKFKDIDNKILGSKSSIVNNIINIIKKDFDLTIKPNSYCLVEHYPAGHDWHVDSGNDGHMSWCEIGVSILLTKPTSGGDTYYKDGDKVIKSNRELYDIVVHTSDESHKVDPHEGYRSVFLMFI